MPEPESAMFPAADAPAVVGLVERLRQRALVARAEETGTSLGDALHFDDAASEIERLSAALRSAVNSHAAMLAALKAIWDGGHSAAGCNPQIMRDIAGAAIAAATGAKGGAS